LTVLGDLQRLSHIHILILSFFLFLPACRPTPQPETPTASTAPAVLVEGDATASPELAPADTAVAVIVTALPAQPPTITPLPTVTAVAATRTALPSIDETAVLTATATLTATAVPAVTLTTTLAASPTVTVSGSITVTPPPAPVGGVVQPPYAPSACSDKYPCNDDRGAWEARIRVPQGFKATYFAHVPGNPTSLTFGPDGLLYVAQIQGTIYRVSSSGAVTPYVSGFIAPVGTAFQPGTSKLYVSSRVNNSEAKISIVEGGAVRDLITGFPCCYVGMHAANGIAFGPDGFGYVAVGARADHGEILEGPDAGKQDELHPWEASIVRFSPDGGFTEVYARGFRNAYDLAWDANGRLFTTDNSPDFGPPERFHRVVPGGQHGYPWYHCDICFAPPADVQIVPPIYQFIPHSAPTGITVYLANQFPGYHNSIFVVLWSAFPGAQKIMRFGPGGTGASNFAMGFAQPIDITVGPDGSLYTVDYATGIIFKITYGQ
jgi:glucose/arabinose dehydrogenase